jgi:hypothetical protein
VISVGRIFAVNVEKAKKANDTESNCGVVTDCGTHSFPVRMYSGMDNRELPKLCVNGQ